MKSFLRLALIAAHTFAICAASAAAAEEVKCAGNRHVVDKCYDVRGRVYFTATSQIVLWPIGTKRLFNVPLYNELYDHTEMKRLEGTIVPLPPQLDALLEQSMIVFGNFNVCPFTHPEPKVRGYVCIESASNLFPLTEEEFRVLQDGPKR
jgi:hypothetical protein